MIECKTEIGSSDKQFLAMPFHIDKVRQRRDCYLVDERKAKRKVKNALAVNREVTQGSLNMAWGLPHRRQIKTNHLWNGTNSSTIKYLALEGTSVTLIGLFRYDIQSGSA